MDSRRIKDLIRTGKLYDLGMEYFVGMPHHPNHPGFALTLLKLHGEIMYEGGVSACNCLFTTGGHTGTHLDAPGHISLDKEVYGVGDIQPWQDYHGLKKGGIETIPPIVTRGVLLDIAGKEEVECLDADYRIDSRVLRGAAEAQGVSIEPGDGVLIRTGWIRNYPNPLHYVSHEKGCPGLVEDGASWLVEQKISCVGSDTLALEKTPTSNLPVHVILLVKNGILIMEVLNLEELAKEKVYEFLLMVSPLKIKGATASPVRPVALS
ncbi:MAG: cyclase family protein [bacterium]